MLFFSPKDCDAEAQGLSSLLVSYQHIIRDLLKMFRFPGASLQEFERFKEDFSAAAFTCRVWHCPLASTGFKSEALRDEHEYAHVPRLQCDVSGCHYPAFTSVSALKNHKFRQHSHGSMKIRIQTPHAIHSLPSRPGSISQEVGSRMPSTRPSEVGTPYKPGCVAERQIPSSTQTLKPSPTRMTRVELACEMEFHDKVKFVQFSGNGTSLAVGYDFHIRILDVLTGTFEDAPIEDFGRTSALQPKVSCACFTPSRLYLMIGCSDGDIRVSCFPSASLDMCHADCKHRVNSSVLVGLGHSGQNLSPNSPSWTERCCSYGCRQKCKHSCVRLCERDHFCLEP